MKEEDLIIPKKNVIKEIKMDKIVWETQAPGLPSAYTTYYYSNDADTYTKERIQLRTESRFKAKMKSFEYRMMP